LNLAGVMPAKGRSKQIPSLSIFLKVYEQHLLNNDRCMNIYVNNKLQELPAQANITAMLEALNISSQKGIAIAINNNVVPGAEWKSYALNENDKVTLIRATQGG